MAATQELSPALSTDDRLSREFPRHNWLENKLQGNYTEPVKPQIESKKKDETKEEKSKK